MVNIEQYKKSGQTFLNISYIDKRGNLDFFEIPVPQSELYEWVKCKPNDPQRDHSFSYFIDGSPVKPKPAKRLNKYRTIEFLEQLNQETKDLIYTNNEPRVFYCDIETGKDPVSGEWARPQNPLGEVNAISLVDSISRKVYVLGLKKMSDTQIKNLTKDTNEHFSNLEDVEQDISVSFHFFESEADLLYAFWTRFMKKIYFITGWNFTGYDWPYLVNRSKKLFLDPFELMGSREMWDGNPLHKVIIDYLDLYKKFEFKILKENFTLDYTASQVLSGIKKISYSGTLDQLYRNNPYKYYLYNAIDSYLVKLIDNKLAIISLYMSIGTSTKAELNTLLKTIAPVESIITRYYYEENLVIIPKSSFNETNLAYEGGYVFEPKSELNKWVMAMDFASLYPSVQQQFNISPESFRGVDYERELQPSEIRLPNGAIFDNSKDSIFRRYLRDFYNKRKQSKNMQLKVDIEISKLEKYLKNHLNE